MPAPHADTSKSPVYPWIGADDITYIRYMKTEWGVPLHDERELFEMLTLEVFQAGLSWATILKRRAGFRAAFARWNLKRVAAFTEDNIQACMNNPNIIRNRRKIEATVANAAAILTLQREGGSFNNYLWSFVNGTPLRQNAQCTRWEDLPTESDESKRLAKEMKQRGFRFLGPVSAYAFMQAVGLVDDRIG